MGDVRLLLPAAGAWATAWCAVGASDVGLDAGFLAWSIWAGAAAIAIVVVAVRARRIVVPAAIGLVVLAAAGLAATSAAAGLERRADSPLALVASEHGTADVVIEIVSAPRRMPAPAWASADETTSLRVDARLIAVEGRRAPPVPVTTTLDLPARDLSLGTHVTLAARATALPGAEQSGYRLRVDGEASITARPPAWLAWAVGPRNGLAETAATLLSGDGAALVPGLAIGDTSAVGPELDAAMTASSLARLDSPHSRPGPPKLCMDMLADMDLTAAQWWSLAAFGLTAFGLIVAGVGVSQTRKEFDPGRPGIFKAIGRSARNLAVQFWIAVKRALGLAKRSPASGNIIVHPEGIGSAEDVPGPTVIQQLSVEERLDRAETKIRDLEAMISTHHDEARKTKEELRRDIAETGQKQDTLAAEFDSKTRRIATGGFVAEVVGLWIAALGASAALIADLIAGGPTHCL